MRNPTASLAIVVAAAALFVAAGGPASAADAVTAAVNGTTIKAGSITGRQLAPGQVTLAKVAASARAALAPAGVPGAAGAAGAKGVTGPTGNTGSLDVQDAQSRRVGTFAGWYSTALIVQLPSGAQLVYDSSTTDNNPTLIFIGPLYYKQINCAGQAYGAWPGTFPVNTAIVLASPPVAGSAVYKMSPAVPKGFSAASRRTAAGCVNGVTAITSALPADAAGVVPTVQKPLFLVPTG